MPRSLSTLCATYTRIGSLRRPPIGLLSRMRILLILLTLCPFSYSSKATDDMKKMKAVKDRILEGYDKLVPPIIEDMIFDNGFAIMVDTDFNPRQIIDVDETKNLFTMDSILCMNWRDDRLKWRESDFNSTLILPPHLLWTPDIYFTNSHSESFRPISDVLLSCENTGLITWCPPILTRTYCPAIKEVTSLYDEIQCNITLGSWARKSYPLLLLTYVVSVQMDRFANTHQRWELVESPHVNSSWREEQESADVEFSFLVRRRPLPEIEATWIPCVLFMVLNLSVFWLPPNDHKKLLVLGFLILALTMLVVYAAENTEYPLHVLLPTSFLLSAMYIVVATFLLQILIIFPLCKFSGPSRPPSSVTKLLKGPFGKITCIECVGNDKSEPIEEIRNKENSISTSTTPSRDDWILFAAALDKLFFVLIFIAVITLHHL